MKLFIPVLLGLLCFLNQANPMISARFPTEEEQRFLRLSEEATKNELVDDTELHTAIRNVNIELVKEIIETNPKLLIEINKNKNTPLHLATYLQVDKNIPNAQEYWNKIDELIDILIQKILKLQNSKELLNAKNIFGNTPLHGAATNNRPNLVTKLLNLKDKNKNFLVERNSKDINNDTPLHCAASFGFPNVIEILATDENVLFQDKIGNTPMHLAAKGNCTRHDSNYAKSMLFLINKTKSKTLFTKNKEGYVAAQLTTPRTPVFYLLDNLHTAIINVLGNSLNQNSVENFITLLKEKMQEYGVQKITDFIDVTTNATILYFASSTTASQYDKIKAVMETFEVDTSVKNNSGNTMLHGATRAGNLELVKYLIEKQNADINIQNNANETPLFVAFDGKQTDLIEYLVNQENIDLEQNLKFAIPKNKLELITVLLKKGAQVTTEMLKLTSNRLTRKKLQNALETQENKIQQQEKVATTLTEKERLQLIEELTGGNNQKAKKKNKKNIKTKQSKKLKKKKSNSKGKEEKQLKQEKLEQENKTKMATKIQALVRGYLAKRNFKELRKQKLELEQECERNEQKQMEIEDKLSKAGQRINDIKESLLNFMSELGISENSVETKKITWLKKLAPKIMELFTKLKDKNNHTVLHLFATYGLLDENLIQEFTDNSGDINAQNNSGETALHLSILNGYDEQSEILINLNADITIVDNQKDSPLHWAILAHNNETFWTQENIPKPRNNTELIKKLINKKTINAKDNEGNTPLHLAAYSGHLILTNILIKDGANVNTQNNLYQTPLYLAAIENHKYIVQSLVDNKTNLDARDNCDKPAFYYVNNVEHEEVASILKAAFNKQRKDAQQNTRETQFPKEQYWRQ